MEPKVALMIIALTLGASHAAEAQNGIHSTTAPLREVLVPSIDARFDNCVSNGNCTVQEHMGLLRDMNNDMRESIARMEQPCEAKDYNQCMTQQSEERTRWHKLYGQMGEVMQSMEAAETMSQKEPAAGPGTGVEKDFWRWWPNSR